MLTRRSFVAGTTAGLAILPTKSALSLESCPAPDLPGGLCSAMLDPAKFASLATPSAQHNSQWCWAACIEMICKYHGIKLSQERIVEHVYGGRINMPADDKVLTTALNSQWESDDGKKFNIKASVFSPVLGAASVSNATVIDDLKNERPLINGSGTHATVVARVDYSGASTAPQVVRVHVIDPWPGAAPPPQYARFLNPQEMTPSKYGGTLRYLASIRIT